MRTIVILAGLGLATSMATADITYYDASANPVPIVPFNDIFELPGGEQPTFFDITKSPSMQGADSSSAIGDHVGIGGFHTEWRLEELFERPDVQILSGLNWFTYPDDDGIESGLLRREALSAGTAIQDHVNTIPDPGFPSDLFAPINSTPVITARGIGPSYRAEGLFGVRLTLPTGTHYGWFELVYVRDSVNVETFPAVSRWAWNDTPGGGILAGQVPAPGAMMVLGVGGLVVARRRR